MRAFKSCETMHFLAGIVFVVVLGSSPQYLRAQSGYCSQNAPACTQAIKELDSNDAEFNSSPGATETGGRAECERYYRQAFSDLASFFRETVAADMAHDKTLTKAKAEWYETNRYFGVTFARLSAERQVCARRPYGKIAEPQ